ncbi:M20 aminoacylase family protein [Anianabacter salinae]|uniref:M20 aminoacylase family protein n=1 Tax=Anianabacter salinae TaxID=2851023 RepID=UPI00225E5AA0|nr:M20 aminoacylase family protein [Anianabacter salinae]MBV0912984.1 amidohydrolase [Anianabacter salinae]
MPVLNRIASFADDMTEWRQHLHRHPELGFACHETAGFVADKLRSFGITDIHEGIATSGLVAIIEGQGDGPTIGLRADMDALPIPEDTGAAHASTRPGVMHACGHDGHTTMLLGAARYLAETRNFRGRVALIFQPAEEDGGGGEVMVQEGVMDRFDIAEIYALHCGPEMPEGQFITTPGPIMAAVDEFYVTVKGKGGHGAFPHECVDPLIAAIAMIQSIQTILSRNHYALDDLVISVTQVHAGTANNVIPDAARFSGTVRTFDPAVQAMVQRRLREVVDGTAAAYGVTTDYLYETGYPATVNEPGKTAFAARVAREVAGTDGVNDTASREMGAEDFSYMLNQRPGAYLFLGTGPGPFVHHPKFDFNDAVAPLGASFFARLVETAQPLEHA